MLTKWSEVEGPGATNEEIIYILEGSKMVVAIKDVFPEKLWKDKSISDHYCGWVDQIKSWQ